MLIREVELPVSNRRAGSPLLWRRAWPTDPDRRRRRGSRCRPVGAAADPGMVEPGAYRSAITVPKDRFAEAKAWLQERVPLLEKDGLDEFRLGPPWNSQSVYFAGPDGILLELIARHDLPAPSSSRRGPLISADLLRISEIGLAVPDVSERRSRPYRTPSDCRCSALPPESSPRSAITTGSSDRSPAGPTLVPHRDPHPVAGPDRCHRRAAKRRKVAGADRELPSQGGVTCLFWSR